MTRLVRVLGARDALRRHVRGGAHPRREARVHSGELARHAEVCELRLARLIEQDVRRLDISVDHLELAVQVHEPADQGLEDVCK